MGRSAPHARAQTKGLDTMTGSIFDGLSSGEVERITSAGTATTLPAGWSPISEQTPADKAYILLEGEVSVRRGGEEIARLGAGDVMGEAAIVNHSLRSASLVALTPLRLIHYTNDQVERLAREVPAFGEALRNAAARPAR